MSPEEQIEQHLENWEPEAQEIFLALSNTVLNASPFIQKAFQWGAPFFLYKKRNLLYCMARGKTLTVGWYRGAELAETYPFLEAADRQAVRHLSLQEPDQVLQETFLRVLHSAIALEA